MAPKAAKRAVTPAREGEHAIKLGSSHDSAFAAAAANGGTPGAKRKARPSADEAGPSSSLSLAAQNGDAAAASTPVSNKVNGAAATTSTSPSTLRDVKRLKRASMSTAPGTPGKRQLPAYVVRQGMNPLPAPIPPITQSVLKSGYAPAVTSPFTRTPAAAEAHLKQGPTIPREAFVFGNGDMGQHGLGTEVLDEIKRPRRHAWVAKMIGEGKLGAGGLAVVAAGGMHTLAIDSTGRIFSWGINDNACLGRQTTRTGSAEDFETEPMPVEGLSPNGVGIRGGAAPIGGTEGPVEIFRATRVAAGDSVSAALNERGEVRVWGSFRSNDGLMGFDGTVGSEKTQFLPVALPALTRHSFVQVACGSDHVLALTTDGIVFSWGNGQQGQLGRRIIERRKINGLTPERLMLKNIVAIGACSYHSFAIDKRGDVWAWGLNTLNQLGVSTNEDTVTMPTKVPSLSPKALGGARVIQAHGGEHHSLFLLDDGRILGAGRCDGCELGIADDHPSMRAIIETRKKWTAKRDEELVSEMAAYEKRMAAKRAASSGGNNAMDMVLSEEDMPPRRGPPPDEFVPEPVHIPFPGDACIVSLACGARHNLAIDDKGTVYSWGFGVSCQLGQGDEEQMETPTPVRSKQIAPYATVAGTAGGQHCILLAVHRGEEAAP